MPVDLDRAGNVAGVVEQHVLVGLDDDHVGVVEVVGEPWVLTSVRDGHTAGTSVRGRCGTGICVPLVVVRSLPVSLVPKSRRRRSAIRDGRMAHRPRTRSASSTCSLARPRTSGSRRCSSTPARCHRCRSATRAPDLLEQVPECQTPFFLATEVDEDERVAAALRVPARGAHHPGLRRHPVGGPERRHGRGGPGQRRTTSTLRWAWGRRSRRCAYGAWAHPAPAQAPGPRRTTARGRTIAPPAPEGGARPRTRQRGGLDEQDQQRPAQSPALPLPDAQHQEEVDGTRSHGSARARR